MADTFENGEIRSSIRTKLNALVVQHNLDTAKLAGVQSGAQVNPLYRDFCLPAAAWRPAATNFPEFTVKDNTDAYAFDTTTEEALYMSFRMPDDYGGGVLRWAVNWAAPIDGAGTAVFGLSGGAYEDGDVLAQALGAERTITDTLLTFGDQHRSPNDATGVTLSGVTTGGAWVRLKFVVKTTSTLVQDVLLLGLQLQYQVSATPTAAWT